ncbi:MAG: hypothetical protein ACLP72_06360 [Candidatus Sulfotelmatobacter sp.]
MRATPVRTLNISGMLLLWLSLDVALFAQPSPQAGLSPAEATKLAEFMCGQLPNVGTILDYVRIEKPGTTPALAPQEPIVLDDVYDALLRLGPHSVSCLTDRLLDTRWMPDPREEPLLGVPLVGDVAYMILTDKGVPDFFPQLTHKKPNELRMDDYFLWPSVGDHRKRLQNAVRAWLVKHPGCCGTIPTLRKTAPSQVKFRMSAADLGNARIRFSRLRPGMSPAEVLQIAGKPDAVDPGDSTPEHWRINLLGYCANDHNENLAYIYFTERWADEIARRDPLRDRYVILFFSAEGKFTRMFSNIADIPRIFPQNRATWERLMWGMPKATK